MTPDPVVASRPEWKAHAAKVADLEARKRRHLEALAAWNAEMLDHEAAVLAANRNGHRPPLDTVGPAPDGRPLHAEGLALERVEEVLLRRLMSEAAPEVERQARAELGPALGEAREALDAAKEAASRLAGLRQRVADYRRAAGVHVPYCEPLGPEDLGRAVRLGAALLGPPNAAPPTLDDARPLSVVAR